MHPRGGDHNIDYSRVLPCAAPGCLLASIKGDEPAEIQRQTFESFQPVSGAGDALKYAKRLAYGEGKFIWLLIYGTPGNGKTHLCNAIVKVAHERGLAVRMILAVELFSMLKEAIQTNQADHLLRKFKEIFLLAIDDYGVEYGSDWESAKFDELMTSRFATGKPTVLITNKQLEDLPARIQSRFTDRKLARAVYNAAPDFRGKK